MALLLAAVAAFATALLSSVTGFGGAVLLLPVFVALFGVQDAVAILTVAQLVSNGSRAWFNRDEIVRPIVTRFSLGAVPAAVVGALVFANAPLAGLTRLIGVFLLLMVVWRRLPRRRRPRPLGDGPFIAVGAASGFGSALVGSVGPLTAPFFLARGLVKGAYIGTEAAAAVVMHATKLVVFGAAAVLTLRTGAIGLALAPAVAAGARIGRAIVDRLPTTVFVAVVEVGLLIAAVLLLRG